MKKIFFFTFLLFLSQKAAIAYNRTLAVEYAKDNWNTEKGTVWNRDYEYYDKNCANFVSQCKIAGGLEIFKFKEFLGFTGFDDKGCINNCDVLAGFFKKAVHINGVTKTKEELGGQKLEDAVTITEGDVIIYGNKGDQYQHAVLVGSGSGLNTGNFGYYANSTDRGGEKSLNFPFGQFSKAAVFHSPTKEEAGCNEKIFATGSSYSGEDVFIRVKYSAEGINIEGFIWENPDPENDEQDMIIGEPEEVLIFQTGCAYLLSGYCIDADKSAPSEDRSFSNVWTSTSSSHWAYWVRKAVEYTNDNYERTAENQMKLQDAIWCVTDRKGAYNEIVKSIGYELKNPSKNVLIAEDKIPPSAITDLHIRTISGMPFLYWIAQGDDGNSGTASYYDVRYASYSFGAEAFNILPQLMMPYIYLYPAEPGNENYCIVAPEEDADIFYFAVKTIDEYGNYSEMSNVASYKTSGTDSYQGQIKAYCWPNPARRKNPKIKIECSLIDEIVLKFYTMTGGKISSAKITSPKEVVNAEKGIYAYEYEWDVKKFASGVYFCVVKIYGGKSIAKKIIKIAAIK
ncbi:amidase domain-containing protein [bacterium]|nr:hypothetical protein [bacterium]MBU3956481.1 amidase domain-containing protein [bacterium]